MSSLLFSILVSGCGLSLISPPYTYAIALGDLDGDGDLDAFFANGKNEEPLPNTVWLNNGKGRFTDSGQRLGLRESHSLEMGDLDRDGDLDVLVGNVYSVDVFLNDGQGNMNLLDQELFIEASGSYSWDVALGDLDGDADLDTFWGGCCGGSRTGRGPVQAILSENVLFLNEGQGRFQDSGQRLGMEGSEAVALGDLDRDGDLDVFVANSGSITGVIGEGDQQQGKHEPNQPNRVYQNNGHGELSDSGQLLGAARSHAVALGDLDNDGDLDAFVGNKEADEVWLNTGGLQGGQDGTFSDSSQRLGQEMTADVLLGDLDGDGDLDALLQKGYLKGDIGNLAEYWQRSV